ncbi:ferric reductase like transmembrane component domain-containing protein [Trichoderma ceciliae]
MLSRKSYLLCLLFAACALAAKPLGHEVCGASCYYTLSKAKFASDNVTEQTLCTHPLRVTSTYLCIWEHCEEQGIVPGINWWALTCKKSSKVVNLQLYESTTANVTQAYIDSLPTVEQTQKTIVDVVSIPSEANWDQVHRTVNTYWTNMVYHKKLRWIPYVYWGLVLLLGTVSHAIALIPVKRSSQPVSKNDAGAQIKGWFHRNLMMAPTFSYHHHQPLGWFTVPLRLPSLVIVGYIITHIFMLAFHYPVFSNNIYYKTVPGQVCRILADRLGIFMTADLPFIFLFGGRANILMYFTGWSYRTFSIFHRWIALVLVVEGIIHGVVFSAYYVNEQGWEGYHEELSSDPTFHYGLIMIISLSISATFAFGQIRKKIYEFFKAAHVSLTAVFLAALFNHIKDQFTGTYKVWVWTCVGLWAGDYVLRLLRVLVMNYKTFLGKGSLALASYSEETGMIRLQVKPSVNCSRQSPGTYYFVYFPGLRFWETHPFTLAGRSKQVDDTSSYGSGSDQPSEKETGTQSPRVTELSSEQDDSYMTFMIRPRDGMTKRLRDRLVSKSESGPLRVRVLLEGPYGTPARLDHFDNVLFIAGGSGITTVLPYLRMFFEDQRSQTPPNMRLAWVVRDEGFVRDVLSNDLRITEGSALAASKLNMEFYVTSGTTSPTPKAGEAGNIASDPRFKRMRPDIHSMVDSFVTQSQGRTAVFVCGPAEIADTTRQAVIRQTRKVHTDVELFEEMFVW